MYATIHRVKRIRLTDFTPFNANCLRFEFEGDGEVFTLCSFGQSEVEALRILRALADADTKVRLPDGEETAADYLLKEHVIKVMEGDND